MNGAELLVKTAVNAGVDVCFSNPGTTELPVVAAFDSVPGIRAMLGLFEGCCTGAADGYGRMLNKPAMTLLHLGPGLANGIANLHNARRAHTPVFNVIGEHATWHRAADPPLTMDIEALAGTVSGWQRTNKSVESLSQDASDAVAAALSGQVSSLIVPHDSQWTQSPDERIVKPVLSSNPVDKDCIEQAVELLRSNQKAALILGGRALRRRGLTAAARIRAATKCDLLSETSPAHIERGVGIPSTVRIPYFPNKAMALLARYRTVILAGTGQPVVFFGYQGGKSRLLTEEQQTMSIGTGPSNVTEALEKLADALEAPVKIDMEKYSPSEIDRPDLAQGKLTAQSACLILAALQPERAIIVEESVTTGGYYYSLGASVAPHSLLTLTGGSIGQGMPCAVGAAIACPDRPVINLQADGSAMYTVQALWMQARHGLNITTLICSNRSYDILKLELARAGITTPGPIAQSLMDLSTPAIDWVQLSKGLGVPAVAVNTCEELAHELSRALAEPGPHLIDMELPGIKLQP